MKSKTSCFSSAIFCNLLKRFWPIYLSYFAIWMLVVPAQLSNTIFWTINNGWPVLDVSLDLMQISIGVGGVLAFSFSALFAMISFHFLYTSKSVSLFASVPIKREGLFLSAFAPGIAVMLVSNLVTMLVAIVISAGHGIHIGVYAMQAFAIVSLMCIFFYGFASFCAMLTGNLIVLPIVYTVLNFTVVVVSALVYQILDMFVYGFSMFQSRVASYLSPPSGLSMFGINHNYELNGVPVTQISEGAAVASYSYQGWLYLGILAVVGVLFTIGAVLLMKRRRMETAGDVVAISPLKSVFKYCMTFGTALVGGIGLYAIIFMNSYSYSRNNVFVILACMVVSAFIGYFVSEMLVRKTVRVFSSDRWKGLGIAILIIAALTLSFEFDLFGYEKNIPAASEVESVYLHAGWESVTKLESPEDIAAVIGFHSDVVEGKTQLEEESYNYRTTRIRFDYTLKNGQNLMREYEIPYDAGDTILSAVQDFLNTSEKTLLRKEIGIPVTRETISYSYVSYFDAQTGYYANQDLTAEMAYELYTECIVPDMLDGNIGIIWLRDFESSEYYNFYCAADITIYLYKRDENGNYREHAFNTTPTVNSLRTNAWLAEHSIQIVPHSEINGIYASGEFSGMYPMAYTTEIHMQ